MKGVFALVGLLLVVAVVGVLAKKNLQSSRNTLQTIPMNQDAGAQQMPPMLQTPANGAVNSRQIQQQFKQQLDAAMQTSRPSQDPAE